jgi:hypothetical protein
MGTSRLPAHIRRLIPQEHREPRKRATPPDNALRDLIRQTGAESELELIFVNRLEHAGLPLGEAQYPFVPGRQHRFDRAWPDHMVAVEIQGGVYSDDGHGRKSIVARDCLKLSLAAAFGWRCLPVTRQMIEDGTAINLLVRALGLEAKRAH